MLLSVKKKKLIKLSSTNNKCQVHPVKFINHVFQVKSFIQYIYIFFFRTKIILKIDENEGDRNDDIYSR